MARKHEVPEVRCAIYTRKSTEEGLEQEFNSLDAQRESAEAFIASQRSEGWTVLPDAYDDGGFTGGNIERPALKRLLDDIKAGRVDCVVVYKVDRLSRSLLDFSRLMEVFDAHEVSFVSVTQQFNTTSSMGRLTLNILLSFAQFEREIISERTSDKIAATRRKGKWSGGVPILGYDVVPEGGKLMVNEDEAERVRRIFEIYLNKEALLETVKELDARGWQNKRYVTRKGVERGGSPFTRVTLYKLLRNVAYIGKTRYKDEVHEGEHPAIVDPEIFNQVQRILSRNGCTGGREVRDRFGAFLKGLIHCVPCGCAMSPVHTKRNTKRYRYYVCQMAQKRGWHTCPSKAIPAGQVEQFVLDQIRVIGKDHKVIAETLAELRKSGRARIEEIEKEKVILGRELRKYNEELARLAGESGEAVSGRMADLQDRIRSVVTRSTAIREEVLRIGREVVDEKEAMTALAAFDEVWDTLAPREKSRIAQLLIKRIEYDGGAGTISVVFHPTGIKTLARNVEDRGHG